MTHFQHYPLRQLPRPLRFPEFHFQRELLSECHPSLAVPRPAPRLKLVNYRQAPPHPRWGLHRLQSQPTAYLYSCQHRSMLSGAVPDLMLLPAVGPSVHQPSRHDLSTTMTDPLSLHSFSRTHPDRLRAIEAHPPQVVPTLCFLHRLLSSVPGSGPLIHFAGPQ